MCIVTNIFLSAKSTKPKQSRICSLSWINFVAIFFAALKFDDHNFKKPPKVFEVGLKSNKTMYLSSKLRCMVVRFGIFAS